jgi:hypothetical protein
LNRACMKMQEQMSVTSVASQPMNEHAIAKRG